MVPYDEQPMKQQPLREAMLKRPGMYLGDMENGQAYTVCIRELVGATLSWQIGATLGIRLLPGNGVQMSCRNSLPDGEKPYEHHWSRPLDVVSEQIAILSPRSCASLNVLAIACREMKWEIRDRHGAGSAVFEEGVCRSSAFAAPDLPDNLCLRVSLVIGTHCLKIAPANIEEVAAALRYQSGPAEAGYWGCLNIADERTGESREVVVTDPPPRP